MTDKNNGKAWVVMPLYYYPLTEKTWKPLHDAISAHPDTNFLVVVNPRSGPGDYPLPGQDYVREIPRLNAFSNVCTVGYVKIDYCRRPIAETFAEIRQYANWATHHSGLYVEGIYVDETPNHVSAERSVYLDAVVHNPGTPPEGDLTAFGNPDLVCICEEPYHKLRSENLQKRLEDFRIDRSRSIYQISGVPAGEVQDVAQEMCRRGQYVFVTDLVDDFYESFGPSWNEFVGAVNRSRCVEVK
ncbi:hypothetical protein JX265_009880 [Neoarthrinium moseri]|uniref:Uncharacterized protein n=1 Tax=Neoarthrinium moseri TaxID=1658444 RepID=A0A9P9WEX8_9PEZI|nr:hypothetical protein JX265_009880 [Neoarthrinium moseri]